MRSQVNVAGTEPDNVVEVWVRGARQFVRYKKGKTGFPYAPLAVECDNWVVTVKEPLVEFFLQLLPRNISKRHARQVAEYIALNV